MIFFFQLIFYLLYFVLLSLCILKAFNCLIHFFKSKMMFQFKIKIIISPRDLSWCLPFFCSSYLLFCSLGPILFILSVVPNNLPSMLISFNLISFLASFAPVLLSISQLYSLCLCLLSTLNRYLVCEVLKLIRIKSNFPWAVLSALNLNKVELFYPGG